MSAILLDSTPAQGQIGPRRRGGRGGLLRAVRGNKKAMLGAFMLAFFCLLAAFPHLFVPWQHGDPRDVGTSPLLHPSTAHWLGTTGLGQDVYAELVVTIGWNQSSQLHGAARQRPGSEHFAPAQRAV